MGSGLDVGAVLLTMGTFISRVLSTLRGNNPAIHRKSSGFGDAKATPFLAHELRRLVHGQKSQ